jgi:copper oxidase (laccase) domain-containing protein
MIEKKIDSLDILFFENLLRHQEIKHFISTRTGGFSTLPYNSLNLGLHVGDAPEKVMKNRKRLAADTIAPPYYRPTNPFW